MSNTVSKNHRTAVFIRVTKDANTPDHVERRQSFVKSLNRKPNVSEGGTIKVDVYTVQGTTIANGLQDLVTGPKPLDPALAAALAESGYTAIVDASKVNQTPTGRIGSPELRRLAQKAGYTQVVTLDSL